MNTIKGLWNKQIIEALLDGAIRKLKERGVKQHNIVLQSVPDNFELPFACAKSSQTVRVIATSQIQASTRAVPSQPFDVAIAIGVHFEYICDAVSHGLMKVQLDSGIPVIFGVLTAVMDHSDKPPNHGEDWELGAVEMDAIPEGGPQGNLLESYGARHR
ncbi:hypothetical protein BS47DRAFT_1376223 [Hydnum rufescens UP504]|uniref:6,7-dimethyl-8-ribityllumazine synthase n=1 Tax=Hydnum rufescens UP504 TaxID=1448309 RepID=A0A9P6B0U3_9AGAM|nr:hypothetical protein BS47DRAFT_1376223 [Hydnum rufescens UP504]